MPKNNNKKVPYLSAVSLALAVRWYGTASQNQIGHRKKLVKTLKMLRFTSFCATLACTTPLIPSRKPKESCFFWGGSKLKEYVKGILHF
jgi:hypothetical protein